MTNRRKSFQNPGRRDRPRQVAKLCGGDYELGNFIYGSDRPADTCFEASRALLREIQGLPLVSRRHASSCDCSSCHDLELWSPPSECRRTLSGFQETKWGTSLTAFPPGSGYAADNGSRLGVVYDAQDIGRRFLAGNGGSCYIDLNHLEVCLPEVLSARDHVAASHAMLRIARRALQAANAKLPEGQVLHVLVNNSDGMGHTYGTHLNFLITRQTWNNIFDRKLHQLLFLATYQASSIIFTGQGKVGSENGRPPVHFQLSQRADFVETMMGEATTFRRPLVNSRDEALCGRYRVAHSGLSTEPELARLHVIFYDNNLCHVAAYLKVGVMQIILAMLEAEQFEPALTLEDPLEALLRWSHDPSITTRARLTSGQRLTALELQFRFLESAKRFVARGGGNGIVPDARNILETWEVTLRLLQARDLPALARRLDWALKLLLIRRALGQHPDLSWSSPEVKHLDQIYGSLDPRGGLYWPCERSGLVEQVVGEDRIHLLTNHPPENTRAWTRGMLLRKAGAEQVDDVDWDFVRFRISGPEQWPRYRSIDLSNPLDFTRETTASIFEHCDSLEKILDALAALSGDTVMQTETVQ